MTNTFDNIDLDKAYEIAGGYIEVDDATFEKALAMVKADDEQFAEDLKQARLVEKELKLQEEKEEAITASADSTWSNTQFTTRCFADEQFKKDFFADPQVQEVVENTPIYDTDLETQLQYELSGEEKDKHIDMLFEKAKLDTIRQTAGEKDFAFQNNDDKRRTLFDRVKTSFFGTILHLKTSSQIENDVPENASALVKGDKSFFTRRLASMPSRIAAALDLKKHVKISANSIMAACADSEKKTSKFVKKLQDLSKRAAGKQQDYWGKAARYIEKEKVAFVKDAKKLWGQRYEFMANLRDRAPKIMTDTAATLALVGATATSAPWLGSAVVAYGAYKVASSWVWPIVSQTRKDVRLAKAADKDSKKSFWNSLRTSANKMFADKKLRKGYLKEAGWGSVAGMVGLGAVGLAASGGLQAAAQRSFQALGSVAVYAGNSFTNAIKKLGDKDKGKLEKGISLAGAAVMTYVLYSCGSSAAHAATVSTPLVTPSDSTEIDSPAAVTDSPTVQAEPASAQGNVAEVAASSSEIVVPDAWNENMSISHSAWNRLQSFWGGREQFEHLYSKITDDMLSEGETREQFLFRYERLSSWNLYQHREALANLDKFFAGCDGASLSESDLNSLKDVLSDGSIKDVEGTECLRAIGRHIECGEESTLQTQTMDCGCNDVVDENTTIDSTPTEEAPAEEVSTPEEPRLDSTIVEEQGTNTTVTTTEEQMVASDISLHKANGLADDGVTVGHPDATELQDVQAPEKTVLANTSSVTIEGDDFVETPGSTIIVDGNDFVEEAGSTNTIEGDDFVEEAGSNTIVTETDGPAANLHKANGLADDGVTVGHPDATELQDAQAPEKTVLTDASSVIIDGDDFIEEPGSTIIVDADEFDQLAASDNVAEGSVETPTVGDGQDEDVASVHELPEINVVDKLPDHLRGTADELAAQGNIGTEEILPDSPDIELGTPSPDNHPVRGGYMDSGLTEKRYLRMETFYKDRFGEDAFELYMDRITDDMRAKGGIFEGLSRAESLYSVEQMIAWSNDQHGAFAKQITAMVDYLKGCNENIAETDLAGIKEVIDKVRENGTIDGVTGRGGVAVKFFQAGDCGEAGTYGYSQAAEAPGITQPSGPKFPRFFKSFLPQTEEPLITGDFVEEAGHNTIVTTYETQPLEQDISIIKANNLGDGKVVATGVSPDDLKDVQAPEKTVLVGSKASESEPVVSATDTAAPAAPKDSVEKLSDAAAAELRQRGVDPKSIPPALYKYLNSKNRQ